MRTIQHTTSDKIFFTSDLHIGHDRRFVVQSRGFRTVEDMNRTIIQNIQETVTNNDYLYILGDLCLCPIEEARYWLSQIPGKVTVIIGNHDTDNRIELYEELGFTVQFGARMKYDKYHFFLSHFPTLSANEDSKYLSLATINLYGHTHQQMWGSTLSKFAFNVGMDAHYCRPVSIENILEYFRLSLTTNKI